MTRCHRLPLSLARRSSCRSPRAGPPRRSRGVASSILHKWEGFGWCSGVITKANDDLRRSIGGDKVNLFAHYEIDGEDENDVPHVLYTCSSSTSTGRRTTPSTTRGAARVTRRRGAGGRSDGGGRRIVSRATRTRAHTHPGVAGRPAGSEVRKQVPTWIHSLYLSIQGGDRVLLATVSNCLEQCSSLDSSTVS